MSFLFSVGVGVWCFLLYSAFFLLFVRAPFTLVNAFCLVSIFMLFSSAVYDYAVGGAFFVF